MVPAPKGSPEPSKAPSKLMVCRWFRADEPGFQSAILSEKMLENQPLAGRFRTFPERCLVPEEDSKSLLSMLKIHAFSRGHWHRTIIDTMSRQIPQWFESLGTHCAALLERFGERTRDRIWAVS